MVTVRLSRASDEVATDTLSSLRLITPQGNYVSLGDVATIENRLGFSIVRRQDGFREVAIQGELDDDVINTSQVKEVLESGDFGNFVKENNIRYRFDGRDQEQGEAFADMASGGVLALLCIVRYPRLGVCELDPAFCRDGDDPLWLNWCCCGPLCNGAEFEYPFLVRFDSIIRHCGE